MHQLCKPAGQEYTFSNSQNHTFSFNICGNTSMICSPGWPLYDSRGVAVQKWTADPYPGCPTGAPRTCTDYDFNVPTCCTGQCAVLGVDFFQFQLLDNNNAATGGVQMVHVGMPPDDADPYNCPLNPLTGLARERQLTIRLYCDPNGKSNDIVFQGISEPSTCSYLVEATTKAACGVKGDPFDVGTAGFNSSTNFGFTILGAALTIGVWYAGGFANKKGWLDGVKSKLPSWMGGGASSGGSYKTVGAPAGGASSAGAAPFSSTAYGTHM